MNTWVEVLVWSKRVGGRAGATYGACVSDSGAGSTWSRPLRWGVAFRSQVRAMPMCPVGQTTGLAAIASPTPDPPPNPGSFALLKMTGNKWPMGQGRHGVGPYRNLSPFDQAMTSSGTSTLNGVLKAS